MSNMVVRTNVFALNSHRNLTNVGNIQRQASQRLSSGFRINSAADDAAGLAISESMRAQIRGLDQASINTQDATGLIQTAEGAMSTISDMVIRIRELIVQAANDTNTLGNRNHIQAEIDQIMTEINDVTFRTQFNTRTLLAGGLGGEGGGPSSPVSLQWMIFDQARIIGMPNAAGIVTVTTPNGNHNEVLGRIPNVHWNGDIDDTDVPGGLRTNTSLRAEVIRIQNDLNALARRVANRMVNDTRIDFDDEAFAEAFPDDVRELSFGSLEMLEAEETELRQLANRLESLFRQGLHASEEIFRITQDQINALGGAGAVNFDGSSVFTGGGITAWEADPGGADTVLGNIRTLFTALAGVTGAPGLIQNAVDPEEGLENMRELLDELVGQIGGPGLGELADEPENAFIQYLEQLMDMSFAVLGSVKLESNAMWFQIGANSMQGMVLQLQGIHTGILGGPRGDLSTLIDVRNFSGIPISEQLDHIHFAENIINGQRAQLGAVQNRLEFTRQSLDISSENLQASESRVRDTDMAREMMRFTQAQVLQQAGISMLAQANQLPSAILQLLQ